MSSSLLLVTGSGFITCSMILFQNMTVEWSKNVLSTFEVYDPKQKYGAFFKLLPFNRSIKGENKINHGKNPEYFCVNSKLTETNLFRSWLLRFSICVYSMKTVFTVNHSGYVIREDGLTVQHVAKLFSSLKKIKKQPKMFLNCLM